MQPTVLLLLLAAILNSFNATFHSDLVVTVTAPLTTLKQNRTCCPPRVHGKLLGQKTSSSTRVSCDKTNHYNEQREVNHTMINAQLYISFIIN